MSAHSVWKGNLAFSLVNIPVKLYKATDEKGKTTSCRTLHSKCKNPINEKTICVHCNVDVPANELVKGFPNTDGTFTILTKEDIDGIKPETSDAIAIDATVPLSEVSDPLWVENSYFLVPDGRSATEAFATVRQGLIDTKRALQGRLTIYGREQSVVIVPSDHGFIVRLFRTKSLVRDASELPGAFEPKAVPVSTEKVKLVTQLINSMLAPFDPTDYEDAYEQDFLTLASSKKSGTALAPKAQKVASDAADLLSALKASLDAAGKPKVARKVVVAVAKGKSTKKAVA